MILSLKSYHSTNNVTINADGSCGGGWVCEHRWNVMKKMVMKSFNELKTCSFIESFGTGEIPERRRGYVYDQLLEQWPGCRLFTRESRFFRHGSERFLE
jgi:hypothetical protein